MNPIRFTTAVLVLLLLGTMLQGAATARAESRPNASQLTGSELQLAQSTTPDELPGDADLVDDPSEEDTKAAPLVIWFSIGLTIIVAAMVFRHHRRRRLRIP